MSQTLTRRRLLGAGAAGLAVAALPGVARAAGPLLATTYPGAWEEAQRAFLLPAAKRAIGADITLTVSQAVDTLARITAAKANPPFDAIIMDEGPYRAAIPLDVFQPLPRDRIPNLAALPPAFVDPQGLGAFVSAQIVGIAYNPKRIATPPSSWLDLWKPEYKGRVGLTNMGSSLGTAWMVEIAKLHGGSEANMDPAFDALRRLLPNVGAVAPNPGALGTLFQQDQIDITFNFLYVVLPLQARGVDIAFALPSSGGVLVRNSLHIVKNCRSPDLAAGYIDAALSPAVQGRLAEAPYYFAPTNPAVPFGSALAAIAPDNAALARMTNTDWATINPQRAALIERFNREVKT